MTSPFLKRHGFPLALAGGMVAFQLLFILLLSFGQPSGMRWLGNTLLSSDEVAMPLSQIRQGRLLIHNPYAVEPHAGRFDLVWSTLGLMHRATGASPVLLHELAKMGGVVALAFALHAAARSVANTEAAARLGSLLMIGGVGVGWMHALIAGWLRPWTPLLLQAPDVAGVFAVAPTLLGSAHTIITFALLVTSIRGIWKAIHDRTRATLGVCVAVLALTLLQPYVIPLLLAVIVVAWTKKIGRRPAHERTHRPALMFFACLIPAAVYNGFLLMDPIFGDYQLVRHQIALGSWHQWLFALAPSVVALVWLARRHDREQRFLAVTRWCMAWLMAAGALLVLPVPWRGVFVTALMVPLVLLTLPAWSAWSQRIPKNLMPLVLIFIVGITPLYLFSSQAVWLRAPEHAKTVGQPLALFHAWDALSSKTNAIVMADDLTIGTWTPAWSPVRSWIGPEQETPGFFIKQTAWQKLFNTEDADEAARLLNETHSTHVLLSTPESLASFQTLHGNAWILLFQEGGVAVMEKTK